MSFDDIIVNVQSRPELWLTSHPHYKMRGMHNKIWKSIAKDLHIDEILLKKRWKHLKDQCRKELKKAQNAKGDAAHEYISSWQWYPAMSFLRDELMHTKRNIAPASVSETESLSEDTEDQSASKIFKTEEPNKSVDSKKIGIILKKVNSIDNKMKTIDDVPKNDTDYMFLMSVLPSMKQLTEIQKLHFRGKINDWLLEAVTQNEYSSTCDNKFFFQTQVNELQKDD